MSAVATLTRVEWKLFRRDFASLFFGLVFPVLLFVALGAFMPGFRDPQEDLDGTRLVDLYLPIVIGLAIVTVAISTLPTYIATHREKGVLRRMATTPVRPSMLLGAQLLVNVAVAVVAVIVTLVAAAVLFDIDVPGNALGFLVAFVLTATATFAVGLVIAAVAPRASTATGIGMAVYFPMLFFSGVWFLRDAMSEPLRAVSDATPIGSGVQAIQDALAGDWPQPLHLAILVAWAVVAGFAAARLFRWE
ncbi:MAG: ABC transporter permease [Jiangellaceae bacterium]